jgi:hypothetical protein
MNVFATDIDPVKAAQNLCDIHLPKMIVESAQMLANAFSLDRLSKSDCPKNQKEQSRTHGYSKHPCTIWTYTSKENAEWLCEHALAMENERHFRWSDRSSHFTIPFIKWCKNNINDSICTDQKLTDFAIAIAQDMKCRKVKGFENLDSISKYRLYYKHDKLFAKWTKRQKPDWVK